MSISHDKISYYTLAQRVTEQRNLNLLNFSEDLNTTTEPTILDVSSPKQEDEGSPSLTVKSETQDASPKTHRKHKHLFWYKKNKKFEEPKLSIPPELSILGALGYASTFNPAMAASYAAKIDSQFFWNFTILDFVGMAFPRISRSLQRGALPYDPEKDPEAQKREGMDKWWYIKQQQINNANWANLKEEMLREIQAAPGGLLVPTLVFSALPLASRLKALNWTGRRSLLMSEIKARQEKESWHHFLASGAKPPHNATDAKGLQALGAGYVQYVFHEVPDAHRHHRMDVHFSPKGTMDPYFHLSEGHIKTLKQGLNPSELLGLKQALMQHPRIKGDTAVTLKNISLDDVLHEIAKVQGELLHFDVEHGSASLFFNPQRRNEHAFLTSKMQALYGIAEQVALQVNAKFSPELRPLKQMTRLHTRIGDAVETEPFLERLRQMDKGRDLMVSALRTYTHKQGKGDLKEALNQAFEHMKGTKSFVTIGSFAWMMGWMWYLAHAIQKGREYPANRLVSYSQGKTDATTNSSSSSSFTDVKGVQVNA